MEAASEARSDFSHQKILSVQGKSCRILLDVLLMLTRPLPMLPVFVVGVSGSRKSHRSHEYQSMAIQLRLDSSFMLLCWLAVWDSGRPLLCQLAIRSNGRLPFPTRQSHHGMEPSFYCHWVERQQYLYCRLYQLLFTCFFIYSP